MRLQEYSGVHDVYEVFIQYDSLDHHKHVGSVLATSADLALQLARENFLRREKAVNIWVVKKNDIHATSSEDGDFFATEFNRDYRRVDGYSDNAKRWKAFKQNALHIEEIVRDVGKGGRS